MCGTSDSCVRKNRTRDSGTACCCCCIIGAAILGEAQPVVVFPDLRLVNPFIEDLVRYLRPCEGIQGTTVLYYHRCCHASLDVDQSRGEGVALALACC